MLTQVFVNGQPTWAFANEVASNPAPDDQVVNKKPVQPVDYEIIKLGGDTDTPPLPDGEYFWNPVTDTWDPAPGSGAGVTGLTNPLTGNLLGANFDATGLNEVAANTITLRDQGGGAVALQVNAAGQITVNGSPLTSASTAPDWTANTPYLEDQLVVDGSVLYRRIAAGTSLANFPADAPNWEVLGSGGSSSGVSTAPSWQASTPYLVDQIVVEAGVTYRRIAAGISSSTFAADSANWEAIGGAPSASTAPDWQATTPYLADQLIVEDGVTYRRITAGTSVSTFAADFPNWEAIGEPSPLTAPGDIYVRNTTDDTRLAAPAENGKQLYRDSAEPEGLAWKGQIVDVPGGGTLVPGFIARIPDGATVAAPSAALFKDMNLGVRLARGATTGIVNGLEGGSVTLNATTPFISASSDGVAWSIYGNSTASGGATLPTVNKGDVIVHNGTTDVALPVGANSTIRIADSTTATGFRDIAQVVSVTNAVARDAAGPLFAGQWVVVDNDDGNGNPQVYLINDDGVNFAVIDGAGDATSILPTGAPGVTFTPAAATPVPAGGKNTIDSIPFAGAVQGDAFVVGAADGLTLRNSLIDVQAYYESDGFVFLELDSDNATAFNVPVQQFTIYKINENAQVNVPGAITGIGGVSGLAPTLAGTPGTASTAATTDHTHPAEVLANAGALTGAVPAGKKVGIDTTTGQRYYDNGGVWALSPGGVTTLTTVGDTLGHDGTNEVRIPAPTENGKQLYSDSTDASGKAWKGQIVDVPNGAAIVPGFISRIPDGATVSAPAAASFANMNAGVRLEEGATSGTITGVSGGAITLSSAVDFAAIESDGTNWTRYAAGGAAAAGGGALPAIGANGSIVIQSGGANVRHHLRIPICFKFNQGNGEIARVIPSLPFEVESVSLSVESGGPVDFTAAIDSGPGTASTNITGIGGVTANAVALTTANATAANTGTNAQYLTVTLSGAAGVVTGYLEAHYKWTGV